MVRLSIAIALIAALASCGGDKTSSQTAKASISTQGSSDNRVAKEVFGRVATSSSGRPQSFGGYARGCQAGAVQLPQTGPTWQAMRLSRNRNWAQPQTVDYIQDLSRFAATQSGWSGLYVGDMSQPRGGPMLTGHASHQTGLDADIWMLPPNRLNLSAAERESLSSISMRRASGAFVNSSWTPQHEAILKAAASDPRVARIFLFPGAKVEMCKNATGDRSWLRKIRPWWGHHYHFHVRLNCPAGTAGCEDQAPPPPGDGCAEAQGWVDRILNPPPPKPADPNATPTPRRGPLKISQLPGQCTSVINN
ncbi:MAG: penicillin-insensitive murein endopeptidase [Loktanella sp.]|jgi:penicillin-insensitive murein DD-endopeptidase|nr:penicillin-insensitive murein endopeptidase [Loktanella sp.]MDO7622814.1 penicillin-insensitive murein endopeptidase [Loktanella sp.]MDO7626007.1 penicillin-insensitive murein endopeptidase [Loktanella sp.]MDO7631587.1 penicillin-insensitive murein endopeptidase [Loktanella sp.]MDO7666224.1 penicillin-insensitive murein endopeptidase [Loktanella sp.]